MARTRSRDYDAVKRAILARAAACFAERGFMGASIGDLAEACGVSRGALYHYFETKQEILFAILDAHVGELLAVLEATVAQGGEPRLLLRRLLRASLALYADFRNEQKVLLAELKFLDAADRATIEAAERRIVALLADVLARIGAGGSVDAMLALGMINYTYTWYDPAGPVGPLALADRAADILLDGLVSPR